MHKKHLVKFLLLPFLTSCVALNLTPEEVDIARQYYIGKHFGIDINCREKTFYCKGDSEFNRTMCDSTCSFRTYQNDKVFQVRILGMKNDYTTDTYHITDVEIGKGLESNYLVASSDNPKNKDTVFKFSISNFDLKNKKLPVAMSEEVYENIEESRRQEAARQLEKKKALAERNKEKIKIKNILHAAGCNQYWNYVYYKQPFIDYLVNLKIDKDNQVYCKKDVYGMDIVYVKLPHQERRGIGLVADPSDKTLYRKAWEEAGEVYECSNGVCRDPLDDISALLGALLLLM